MSNNGVCHHWVAHGWCRYGSKCKFSHPTKLKGLGNSNGNSTRNGFDDRDEYQNHRKRRNRNRRRQSRARDRSKDTRTSQGYLNAARSRSRVHNQTGFQMRHESSRNAKYQTYNAYSQASSYSDRMSNRNYFVVNTNNCHESDAKESSVPSQIAPPAKAEQPTYEINKVKAPLTVTEKQELRKNFDKYNEKYGMDDKQCYSHTDRESIYVSPDKDEILAQFDQFVQRNILAKKNEVSMPVGIYNHYNEYINDILQQLLMQIKPPYFTNHFEQFPFQKKAHSGEHEWLLIGIIDARICLANKAFFVRLAASIMIYRKDATQHQQAAAEGDLVVTKPVQQPQPKSSEKPKADGNKAQNPQSGDADEAVVCSKQAKSNADGKMAKKPTCSEKTALKKPETMQMQPRARVRSYTSH